MDLYLPIANLSVNALVIIALGGVVGLLSGMFGVGGGFLTTPLLIFYGIPPTVAAASAASQVTGASVSGVVTHMARGTVDFRMGGVLIGGGVIGAGIGVILFRLLQSIGQIDTAIGIIYVLMLGGIGLLMARESIQALIALKRRSRCAGASIVPACTSRPLHHCCWAWPPVSSRPCWALAAASFLCQPCFICWA
jgi:uncharacterized membrane protein YfcA